jgi:hypothetical protein
MEKKPQPPVPAVVAASALGLLAVVEHAPEMRSQLVVSTQESAQRSEEADELHQHEETRRAANQEQVQLPPPAPSVATNNIWMMEEAAHRQRQNALRATMG